MKYYFGFVFVAHRKLNHPSQAQLAKRIKENHLILNVENIIKQVHSNCLLCTSLLHVPTSVESFSTTPVADHPYQQCSADIIKRAKQYILVVTDALSQHTSTTLIKSESTEDISKGLLKTILPFKQNSLLTQIKVDTAPGLTSIIKNKTALLNHDIVLETGRTKKRQNPPS